jgi:hypothetical protein
MSVDVGASFDERVAIITASRGENIRRLIRGLMEVILRSRVMLSVAFSVSAKYTHRIYP